MSRLLKDPFVAQQVQDAVAPFVGRLSEADIAWMRAQLAQLLVDDPEVAAALKGAHPRNVDVSGERAQLGIDDDDVAAQGGGHI